MTFQPFENLKDGCVVVAGGSGGLGRDIVRKFASVGSNVAFSYLRREQPAQKLEREVQAMGVQAFSTRVDLTDVASTETWIAQAEQRFGRIHTVVYASGPLVTV